MAFQIQLRRDTLANWTAANPILAQGELSYVTDGAPAQKIKIGDGSTAWLSLGYFEANQVSDAAYDATSWDGVTNISPSKNSVRDEIEALITSISGKAPTSHSHALSDITQSGATTSQIPQWSGTAWVPVSIPSSESTTVSNVGTGSGVFKQLTGSDIELRKINAGTGITVTQNASDITVDSTITQYTDTLARAAVVIDSIADADVDHAPSRNAVFDALALKADTSSLSTVATSGSHTDLSNIGTNSHATIDTHLASTSNPHSVTKAQVGLGSVVNADTTTTANITDSTNKRFVTDANLTVIGNTSGTNTGDQTAATVPNTPAGNIAATDVQAAINELDSEKQPLDAQLTSLAALSFAGNSGLVVAVNGAETNFELVSAAGAAISDAAYDATAWNGVTGTGASKNALRDKFEDLVNTYATVALDNLDTNTAINSDNLIFDSVVSNRVFGGTKVGTANAPSLTIRGFGTTGASGFNGGDLNISTPNADVSTGNVNISTTSAANGKAGDISISAGTSGEIMMAQQQYGSISLTVGNFAADNTKSGIINLGEGFLNRYVTNDPSLVTTGPITYSYSNFSTAFNPTVNYSDVYAIGINNSLNFGGVGAIVHSGTNGTHTAFQNSVSFAAQNTIQYLTLESGNVAISNNSSVATLNAHSIYTTVSSGSNCTNVNGISINHITNGGGTTQNANMFYASFDGPCDNSLYLVNTSVNSGFVGDYINGVTVSFQDGISVNSSVTGYSFNPGTLSGASPTYGVTGLVFYYDTVDPSITNLQTINCNSSRATMNHNGPINQYRQVSLGATDFTGTNSYGVEIDDAGAPITAGFCIQTNFSADYIGDEDWTGSAIPGIPPLVAMHGGATHMGQGDLLGAVGLAFTASIEDRDIGMGPIPTNGNLTDAIAILLGCENNSTGTGVITNAYGVKIFGLGATNNFGFHCDIAGSTNVIHELQIRDASSIKFYDTNSSNYVAFKSAGTVSSDVTWTLPSADAQGAFTSDGSGAVSLTKLSSGTYTPTLTNVTNVSASTAYKCQWMRVGNTVTVSGKIDIDSTAPGALEVGVSLPVASNFANEEDCAGTGVEVTGSPDAAWLKADATNNRASFNQNNNDTSNHSHFFTFTYEVI